MAKTRPTPKAASTKANPAPLPELEAYTVVEVHRSQLKDAPYNPRLLSPTAQARLKAGIKKVGLLAPPIWNVTTGHIVGGHQRIHILDSLKGTQDYTLRVAQVTMDEIREKEANLLLNNPEAQGDWDLGKLEAVLKTENIQLDAAGFDVADVYRLFGAAPLQTEGQLDEMAKRLRETKARFDEVRKGDGENEPGGETDFYLVVVFKDAADRFSFCQSLHLEDNRYQDGRELRRLLTPGEDDGSVESMTPPVPPPVKARAKKTT